MDWNLILEDAIVGRVYRELLDNGKKIVTDDRGDGFVWLYVFDEEQEADQLKFPTDSYVKLVPGNGVDVIVDYTTNLEAVLKPADDFADKFRQ